MAKGKGQVPFEPTEKQRAQVMAMATVGVPQKDIAAEIKWPEDSIHEDHGKPISVKTLRKVFRDELDNGMQRANATVIATAFDMITKDRNTAVTIFWLKTRCGWKEPASEVNLSLTYGQLIETATKKAEEERKATAALTLVQGGKAA